MPYFGNYYNTLEREFYNNDLDPNKRYNKIPAVEGSLDASAHYSVSGIGTTDSLRGNNTDPIKLVQAQIRKGTGHLEISADGTGGGGGQGIKGFEQIDAEERAALRDIQKAVGGFTLTTHATPAVAGGAGFDPRSGRYSERSRKAMMDEVKKAIDFASEATFGGSVVVHTGEFQRPMFNMPGMKDDKGHLFESHPFEKNDASYMLVDGEEEKLISNIGEDEIIQIPRIKIKDGKPVYTTYANESGKQETLRDPFSNRPLPMYEEDKDGQIIFEKTTFKQYVDKVLSDENKRKKVLEYVKKFDSGINEQSLLKHKESAVVREAVAKEMFLEQQQLALDRSLNEARNIHSRYQELKRDLEEKRNALNEINRAISQTKDDREKEALEAQRKQVLRVINVEEQQQANYKEIIQTSQRQFREVNDKLEKIKTQREFSLDRSYNTYAQLGIYAMDKYEQMQGDLKKTGTDQKMKHKIQPIAITLENLYPEEYGYGAEAKEIIDIIQKSQQRMTELLTKKKIKDPTGKTNDEVDNPYFRGMSEEKAKEVARQTIKMTFDTGHLNMWKKHFVKRPGESTEKYEERYKKWYLDQVDQLVKADVIGNVHLADNFGYDDSHLAPGYGNAYIKEAMKKLAEDKEYKGKMVVEGGWAQGKTLHEGWRTFHANIFAKDRSKSWTEIGAMGGRGGTPSGTRLYDSMPQGDSWHNVQDGYLGRMHRPYFIFGAYNTGSQEENRPWSQTNLE